MGRKGRLRLGKLIFNDFIALIDFCRLLNWSVIFHLHKATIWHPLRKTQNL